MKVNHAVFGNYKRKFLISNAALEKLRKYLPEGAHRTDTDLGNLIDEAICKAGLENAEEFWENDFNFGVQKNKVVKIAPGAMGSELTLYAVLRNTDEDGPIVITILSNASKDAAERDRWSTTPPDITRKVRRERGREINTPFEKLSEFADSVPEKPKESKELMIMYPVDASYKVIRVGPEFEVKSCEQGIVQLISKGVSADSISVWERKKIKVKVSIKLDGVE